LSLLAASTAQLASMVSEPVRCVFGGFMWLKQPDSQLKRRSSAEYQGDAYVARPTVDMQPGASEEKDPTARHNAQAGKDQCQPGYVPESERLELQLNSPLEGASS
jgi:hypothetical protein